MRSFTIADIPEHTSAIANNDKKINRSIVARKVVCYVLVLRPSYELGSLLAKCFANFVVETTTRQSYISVSTDSTRGH
jgi:hypothetical protein